MSLFAKMLVCDGCNSKLAYNASKKTYKSGKVLWHGSYYCRTHAGSGGAVCSGHRISELVLINLVFSHIKEQAERLTLDEDGMLQSLRDRLIGDHSTKKHDVAKECRALEAKLHSLEIQAEQLYEDKMRTRCPVLFQLRPSLRWPLKPKPSGRRFRNGSLI